MPERLLQRPDLDDLLDLRLGVYRLREFDELRVAVQEPVRHRKHPRPHGSLQQLHQHLLDGHGLRSTSAAPTFRILHALLDLKRDRYLSP